jgi:steroid 5-alpha reductase family enzyme
MQPGLLLIVAISLSAIMALAWALERKSGKSGWIDAIWSFSVGLGSVIAVVLADAPWQRRSAILILILAWSLRLGLHIAQRSMGHGEDPRYAKLIKEWGEKASSRLFWFLQIQALAAFMLVLAVYLAAVSRPAFPSFWDIIAVVIIAIALIGEALSDAQLAQFRRTPEAKTEICETGLWAYSRHPNYFFEWLFWCAWPLMAITASPWSWLSLIAPIQMYWLLVHVSGIPPLEEHMLKSRGEKFRALQRRVNAFFPGPRKSPARSGAST